MTCNEEVKGNTKCKNSRFEPPFGDLGVTHKVHLWLDGKRVVDFLLAIIAILVSSHSCGTITKSAEIGIFRQGWVTLSANFR